MTSQNVCKEIDCPYYNSEGSSGCTFYVFAFLCHLLPNANLEANEYFIYSKTADIPLVREKNDRYFSTNEKYILHNKMKQRAEWKTVIKFPSREI